MSSPGASASARRPAHRVLLAFSILMLVVLLLVQGLTTRTIGAASTGSRSTHASPLANVRPILSSDRHGGLQSIQPAIGRRVALTFDDGPSPQWTPRIARILLARHVPATFFEIGGGVVRHPDIVKMLWRNGFELGNHTFTHANLAALPAWQRSLQIGLTESAFSGVLGIRPTLVRPPYSSTTDAITPLEEHAWGSIAHDGYTIVVSDFDTTDWNQPGTSSIIANATPPAGEGGIVLLHDGGGRRGETVAALPHLIDHLRARGLQFVTVSALMGKTRAAVDLPATSMDRIRGELFVTTLAISRTVTAFLTAVVLLVMVLVAFRMILVLLLARRQVRATRHRTFDPHYTPGVSILVPAYNEALGISRCVRSLAGSRYDGPLEVIVVDDGSTDGTADLVDRLGLPGVSVLRQQNAGKPVALNRALAASHHEIVVTVDGDTVFEPDTLAHLVQPFAADDVGAVSGNTKVGNRGGLVGRWQHIEYVVGFNLDRRMYEALGCMPTVPGAIGGFRRAALADIGGVSGATLAEDTDVTMDIGSRGWRVLYMPDARAWTEVPSTLGGLWRQRTRWAYGTMQAVWKHRRATVRLEQDRIGHRAIPYLVVFQILLPLAAPLIDLFAIYGVLFLDPLPILAFWLAFNSFQFVLAWVAFGYDGESRRPLWALPLQQIAHRQLCYLVVIESALSALMGTRLGWARAARTGEIDAAPVTDAGASG